jgi:hypothetical protein
MGPVLGLAAFTPGGGSYSSLGLPPPEVVASGANHHDAPLVGTTLERLGHLTLLSSWSPGSRRTPGHCIRLGLTLI